MKKNVSFLLLTFLVLTFLSSCSKDSTSTSNTATTTTTTTISNTQVIFTVKDLEGNLKSGYTIMMFTEEVDLNEVLPTIEMQVLSNSEGIAKFDLNDYIVNPTTLYFEAFIKDGNNYIFKSITHPVLEFKKGSQITTGIYAE
ncbi:MULTISPECIES: hypothetical protein [unclassified Lentimicrobium]|uniref:hypothetical protein n=1 Tax=unclassified Lentimicrobium TaxID=2677434 RepID=UPI0015577E1B|nr:MULTISPECIES: hypothetical protein [unclassified Lentimicrobium]NPD47226.1 hypothetical protein [Lentimicrobium sp. S6]NPD83743.1 hypothetical protein [Lentimicrobium sp. L6]